MSGEHIHSLWLEADESSLLGVLDMLCVSAWDVPEYASPTFHRELKDKIKRLVAPSKIQASLRAAAKIVGGPDGVVASQDAQRLVEKFFTDVFSHCSDHNTDRTASRVETLKGFDPQTFIFIAFAYQFEEVLALDRHSFAYLAEKTKDLLCSLNLPMRWVFQEPIWEAVSHRKDDDGDDVELFRQNYHRLNLGSPLKQRRKLLSPQPGQSVGLNQAWAYPDHWRPENNEQRFKQDPDSPSPKFKRDPSEPRDGEVDLRSTKSRRIKEEPKDW